MKKYFLIQYILQLFCPRIRVQIPQKDWGKYNGKVKLVREVSFEAVENGGKFLKGKKIDNKTSAFDITGNLRESILYYKNKMKKKYCYKYDRVGNLLSEKEFGPNGKLDDLYIYKYRFFNKRAEVKIFHKWKKRNMRLHNIFTYAFNVDGYIITRDYGHDTYEYDNTGHKIEERMYEIVQNNYPGKGGFRKSLSQLNSYEYDNDGNLIRKIIHEFGNHAYITFFKYEFDSFLNWIWKLEVSNTRGPIDIKIVEREITYY